MLWLLVRKVFQNCWIGRPNDLCPVWRWAGAVVLELAENLMIGEFSHLSCILMAPIVTFYVDGGPSGNALVGAFVWKARGVSPR